MPDPAGPEDLPVPVSLTEAERNTLLLVARTALAVAVGSMPRTELEAVLAGVPGLGWPAAAFVTLTEGGELRGCVGHMDPRTPVEASVARAASWAALQDPRFVPVQGAELGELHLEVSVLGPLVRLDDPARFRPGIDGMIAERGGRRGLLLPEVADALGAVPTAMLDAVCRKAGLPVSAWRDPDTRLFVFRTDRFGGPAVVAHPSL